MRCLCLSLDTSLKAIHNSGDGEAGDDEMFMPIFRYKFESNSQPVQQMGAEERDVYAYL